MRTHADSQLPTLECLVVSATAAAEGMEAALWKQLRADFPALAWRAAQSRGIEEGRQMVLAGGAAAIPKAFPALSTSRAAQWAEGTCRLPGGGQGMWWGLQGGAQVGSAVDSLQREAQAQAAKPAAAAAAAAAAAVAARSPSVRVGLLGARGFVGRELLALIGRTSSLEVVCASSRALVGQPVEQALGAGAGACTPNLLFSDIGPKELASGAHPPVDVWVLALPNGHAEANSAAIVAQARASGRPTPLLLDLSADMRFKAKGGEWVYGFPEAPGGREALRKARMISNPGCYATGAQAALLPLLAAAPGLQAALRMEQGCRPHVFGVSGYSGAGTTPSDKNDPARLR